jgi:hypothetical protein
MELLGTTEKPPAGFSQERTYALVSSSDQTAYPRFLRENTAWNVDLRLDVPKEPKPPSLFL